MNNTDKISQILERYDVPAILVSPEYVIQSSNKAYRAQFGVIDLSEKPNYCAVSHGYTRPVIR